jgi:peptide deformylase
MAALTILEFPDPRLKLVAKPVEVFDAHLAAICADLLETMYKEDGVGLAATQANIQLRIFTIDVSDNRSQPLCIINPNIVSASGSITWEEGCLSFPNVYAKVKRSAEIVLEYFNQLGEKQTLAAEGLLAVCIQHELDHLNGITFYDHLSTLKKQLIRKKIEKLRDRIS